MVYYIKMDSAYNGYISQLQKSFDTKIETAVEDMVSMLEVNNQRYQNEKIIEDEALETAKKLVRHAV